jgi:hypothetical protein
MENFIEDTENVLTNLDQIEDEQLRKILEQLYEEEAHLSYKRRVLHGRIDILRAELTERLKEKHQKGQAIITGNDIDRLSEILARGGINMARKSGADK